MPLQTRKVAGPHDYGDQPTVSAERVGGSICDGGSPPRRRSAAATSTKWWKPRLVAIPPDRGRGPGLAQVTSARFRRRTREQAMGERERPRSRRQAAGRQHSAKPGYPAQLHARRGRQEHIAVERSRTGLGVVLQSAGRGVGDLVETL